MVDLSAVDAELAQLGQLPEDPLRLAHDFAGAVGTLAEVDEQLSTLAQQSGVPEAGYVERPARGPAAIKSIAELPAVELTPSARSGAPRKRTSIPPPPAAESVPPASAPTESRAPDSSAPESAGLSEPPHALHAGGESEGIAHLEDSQWPTAMTGQPMFTMPPASVPPGAEAEFEAEATPSWRPQSEPPREAVPLTQSQEIVLPDPVSREELSHESGELRLDTEAPSSGSYSLPDAQPSGTNEFADMVDDEVQDALEGSQPLSLGAPARTMRSPEMDRDPDAEFDALLSEATDPRGMPVGSSELDTDELLRGLEGDDFEEAEEAHLDEMDELAQGPHEADSLVKDIFDEPEADNTEILDRASALAIEAQAPGRASQGRLDDEPTADELALDAEIDSGELEIMLDEEPQSAASNPPAKPLASKGPPPPPGEKRPSILGRFFGGKRDGE